MNNSADEIFMEDEIRILRKYYKSANCKVLAYAGNKADPELCYNLSEIQEFYNWCREGAEDKYDEDNVCEANFSEIIDATIIMFTDFLHNKIIIFDDYGIMQRRRYFSRGEQLRTGKNEWYNMYNLRETFNICIESISPALSKLFEFLENLTDLIGDEPFVKLKPIVKNAIEFLKKLSAKKL